MEKKTVATLFVWEADSMMELSEQDVYQEVSFKGPKVEVGRGRCEAARVPPRQPQLQSPGLEQPFGAVPSLTKMAKHSYPAWNINCMQLVTEMGWGGRFVVRQLSAAEMILEELTAEDSLPKHSQEQGKISVFLTGDLDGTSIHHKIVRKIVINICRMPKEGIVTSYETQKECYVGFSF